MDKTRRPVLRKILDRLQAAPVEYDLRKYRRILGEVEGHNFRDEKDESLRRKSAELSRRVRKGTPLDVLLGEAFALVREASWRMIRLRHFDVQVIAGVVMHQGKIAEMPTGEGKTLAAVLPAYLNALSGRGVHIHTFNDYLARRDAAWMGPVYTFLGLSVGCIQEGMSISDRQKAYAADVTYSTSREAGFDYLRDHLCYNPKNIVHRPFHFVLVDEADSILIDEARVPLVIAGSLGGRGESGLLNLAEIVKGLRQKFDFETDEGRRNIYLTEAGVKRVEEIFGCENLHALENLDLLTQVNLALQAEYLIQRDIDYIVRKGRVEIVDEFTGRVVEDRHWPDGLQAAVEAKEKLRLGESGSILGSTTLQHFLHLYPKICGMTATAQTAAQELDSLYKLKVVVIPPNRPCIRKDLPDVVFTHKEAKTKALIEEINRWHARGRPVLVGTASVDESEKLAATMKDAGIECQVLNAKNDELEAKIIARAGAPGAVTISTNMAGRGTDIKLGGEMEEEKRKVVELGGLYMIGTNRHESLRVDFQLRGRAGRQGDPGASRFFVSLEDDLVAKYELKNFFPPSLRSLRQEAPLVNPLVNRAIRHGQRVIEGQNNDVQKTLWKYSTLSDKQREVIYSRREAALLCPQQPSLLAERVPEKYGKVKALVGEEKLREIERQITLFHVDRCWAEHLAVIADVRESIHLVNVGGASPIDEFNKTITKAFLELDSRIDGEITKTFESLEVSEDGVDLDKGEVRGPSSTWTYLVSDSQFGAWLEILKGKNIGFAAGAAAWYGPLLILWGILQKIHMRDKESPKK